MSAKKLQVSNSSQLDTIRRGLLTYDREHAFAVLGITLMKELCMEKNDVM